MSVRSLIRRLLSDILFLEDPLLPLRALILVSPAVLLEDEEGIDVTNGRIIIRFLYIYIFDGNFLYIKKNSKKGKS